MSYRCSSSYREGMKNLYKVTIFVDTFERNTINVDYWKLIFLNMILMGASGV